MEAIKPHEAVVVDNERLVLHCGNERVVVLPRDEIDWVEGSDEVEIHACGTTYEVPTSLDSIEQQLDPERFMRIHSQVIVNLDRVQSMSGRQGRSSITIGCEVELPIARKVRARLKKHFTG